MTTSFLFNTANIIDWKLSIVDIVKTLANEVAQWLQIADGTFLGYVGGSALALYYSLGTNGSNRRLASIPDYCLFVAPLLISCPSEAIHESSLSWTLAAAFIF